MTILTNRVISIYNRKTTMRLASAEWNILDNICYLENMKRKSLLELIDQNRDKRIGFTPSVRLFALLYFNELSTQSAINYRLANSHENLTKILPKLKI